MFRPGTLIHFLVLYALLSLSARANPPVLPGNSIDGNKAAFELESIVLQSFTTEKTTTSVTNYVDILRDKISGGLSTSVNQHLHIFKRFYCLVYPFYYDVHGIEVLDINSILRI
ncbi:MAG: hypothetical protein LT105_07180 [Lentimicrobium sp.]|nr:hypothetical protein [Lentimicrobium sp.]